jgi:hypothetical protein
VLDTFAADGRGSALDRGTDVDNPDNRTTLSIFQSWSWILPVFHGSSRLKYRNRSIIMSRSHHYRRDAAWQLTRVA